MLIVFLLAPVNPPDIIYVDGDCWRENANLVWKLGSFNNEEEIFFYLIQWSTMYLPEVWMNMSLIRQEDYVPPARLDFTKLPPYSQISFRVIVRNRIGPSEPSKPTDPATCLTAASGKEFVPDPGRRFGVEVVVHALLLYSNCINTTLHHFTRIHSFDLYLRDNSSEQRLKLNIEFKSKQVNK